MSRWRPSARPRLPAALAALALWLGACGSEDPKALLLELSIANDAPRAVDAHTLHLAFRTADGAMKLPTVAGDVRFVRELPVERDLRDRPYVLKVVPEVLSGVIQARLAMFAEDGELVASWAGLVNLDVIERRSVLLRGPDFECDVDGDGARACEIDGCCAGPDDIPDCDDDRPDQHPFSFERCTGFDDDCDGKTDEGFEDLRDPCDSNDLDRCANGRRTCRADGTGTECTAESESDRDIVEACNGADDDCDGETDEDFALLGEACDSDDDDQCPRGTWVCAEDGAGEVCEETDRDAKELCNGIDDDCDGETDEGFSDQLGQPCDSDDEDSCANGTFVCSQDGSTVHCPRIGGEAVGIAEQCNGLDDDCDGETDEGFLYQDAIPVGEPCDSDDADDCPLGRVECSEDGAAAVCPAESEDAVSRTELCDGVDNDCDGETDEDFQDRLGVPCDSDDTDLCENGRLECSADGTTVVCGLEMPRNKAETCNGVDDDCDGETDEDFGLLGTPCDSDDTDQCPNGTISCAADGASLWCPFSSETVGNIVEQCNGVDDDCDGETDEGFDLGARCDTRADPHPCRFGEVACHPTDPTRTVCVDGQPRQAGLRCAELACVEGLVVDGGTCDELGECVEGQTTFCEGFQCADETTCREDCTGHDDCVATHVCRDGLCRIGDGLGSACIEARSCATTFCADGLCCNRACDAPCQRCDGATSTGRCTPVLDGPDPGACDGDRTCNARGECKLLAGTPCDEDEACLSGECATVGDGDRRCARAEGEDCSPLDLPCKTGTGCALSVDLMSLRCLPVQGEGDGCGPGVGPCREGSACAFVDGARSERRCVLPTAAGEACPPYGAGPCAAGSSCRATHASGAQRRCLADLDPLAFCGATGQGGCPDGTSCAVMDAVAGERRCADRLDDGAVCGGDEPRACLETARCAATDFSATFFRCYADGDVGEACGGFGRGGCLDDLTCRRDRASDPLGVCGAPRLAGEACGGGLGDCHEGTACVDDAAGDGATCRPDARLGEPCGAGVAACMEGLDCSAAACVDPCAADGRYGDGACDRCWDLDPDCD